MNYDELMKKLSMPFAFNDVDWRILRTNKEETKGMAIPYLTSRAIQDRLDNVVGINNWQNKFQSWPNNAQICGISIYDEDKKEWITKCDGAENTDFEPVKGGISDAFKRAAVHWGIGRYLYGFNGLWVETEKRGKGSFIKESEEPKLKPFYEKTLAALKAGASGNQSSASSNTGQTGNANPGQQTNTNQQKTANQQPAQNQQTAQGGQPNNAAPRLPEGTYKVVEIRPGGNDTSLIKIIDHTGEVVETYAKSAIKSVGVGGLIRKLDIQHKKNDFQEFNVLNSFEKAA